MHNVIQLERVTKTYGSSRGVTDISLDVPEGSVFGFLGPNGAGKTTTISMIMNLTHPTSGTIKLFGNDIAVHGLESRARIGFLAGDIALDKGLTGRQQLEYFGSLRGGYDKAYMQELAARLQSDLSKKIKSLSRGNRQKVGLIAALMHKPDLLILDEPTSGLDPLIQSEFNKIILEHKAAGRTTFISSHVLSEVQELCDQIAIIREGKLATNKSLQEIVNAAPRMVRITSGDTDDPAKIVEGLKGVDRLAREDHSVHFHFTGDINELIKHLGKKRLKSVTIHEADLEEIFMSYYAGEVHNA